MSIVIPKFLPKSEVKKGSWQPYLFLGLIANAAIWSSALLYLKLAPASYISHSAIAVPGEGSSVNVNLPNIGEANYQNTVPYSNGSTLDPRENYKYIAESEPVLKAAAEQLKMNPKQFGEPKIKIVDNTAIMEISFKGENPKEARNKSLTFYKAFEIRVNQLRVQAVARRDVSFQNALGTSQKKLQIAQNRLYNYKANSGLNTEQQVTELSASIESLRKQRAEILAQQQQARDRLKQLSADLNLSTQQAADAFVLKSDKVFQQNLKDYSETKAALDILTSKFFPNAPKVIEQKAKLKAAEKAILSRTQFLLGKQVSLASLRQLNLSDNNSNSAQEQLFQQLIAVNAEQKGLQGQAQVLDKQIANFENRLKNLGKQETILNALKRDLQVAETVFSSSIAKLDVGKSNIFGTYPLIQVVAEPTLPEEPSWPNNLFILVSATISCFLIDTGIVLMWLNQRNAFTVKRVKPRDQES